MSCSLRHNFNSSRLTWICRCAWADPLTDSFRAALLQRLFEVPRLDGVFARINSVYTQYSEYHNFLRALRSLLGLPDNAGTGACVARIRALLDQVRIASANHSQVYRPLRMEGDSGVRFAGPCARGFGKVRKILIESFYLLPILL